MRHPYDRGASPNARYEKAPKKRAIPLSSSQKIRIFADFNKVMKVSRSMIRIQSENTIMLYTIWDKTFMHMLNGLYVRVRMLMQDTSVIYLFDEKTDSYLTFVEREIETAGDLASIREDPSNEIRILAHSQKLKGRRNHRANQLKEALAIIEQEDSNHRELPESFGRSGNLITGEPGMQVFTEAKDDETSEQSTNTQAPELSPDTELEIASIDSIADLEEVCALEIL